MRTPKAITGFEIIRNYIGRNHYGKLTRDAQKLFLEMLNESNELTQKVKKHLNSLLPDIFVCVFTINNELRHRKVSAKFHIKQLKKSHWQVSLYPFVAPDRKVRKLKIQRSNVPVPLKKHLLEKKNKLRIKMT